MLNYTTRHMVILAIETSCDETACAIVENGVREIAWEVASSAKLHEKTGGVVPEVAARKQVEFIAPVLESTIQKAARYYQMDAKHIKNKVDALAVTVGPGLIGSLIVGVEACKALSLAWNKPIIPVNHLIGHIYANFITESFENNQMINLNPNAKKTWNFENIFPAVSLVVSGGHTDLVLLENHGQIKYLGGTLDDAAGEAFDKVARLLGYANYLGGPILSKAADNYSGPNLKIKLPRPLINKNDYNFSFSGLKTAVKNLVDRAPNYPKEAIAKEFQQAVVDVLVKKTIKAALQTKAKSILLGGGVSANIKLREELNKKAKEKIGENINIHTPPLRLCADAATYIACAAYFNPNFRDINNIQVNPSLTIKESP